MFVFNWYFKLADKFTKPTFKLSLMTRILSLIECLLENAVKNILNACLVTTVSLPMFCAILLKLFRLRRSIINKLWLPISEHCSDEMNMKTVGFEITFNIPNTLLNTIRRHVWLKPYLNDKNSYNNLNKHKDKNTIFSISWKSAAQSPLRMDSLLLFIVFG